MSASTSTFQPVLTKAALALQKQNKSTHFEATVFEEPKSFSKKSEPASNNDSGHGTSQQGHRYKNRNTEKTTEPGRDPLEFDIKKARHEVLTFAMNNQRNIKNKKKMETFQAVKLGAKAPKRPYKNYKELVAERKRLKTIREERKKFHQLGKNQTGAASVKCKSRTKLDKQNKKRAPVSSIAQHYGVANPKLRKK